MFCFHNERGTFRLAAWWLQITRNHSPPFNLYLSSWLTFPLSLTTLCRTSPSHTSNLIHSVTAAVLQGNVFRSAVSDRILPECLRTPHQSSISGWFQMKPSSMARLTNDVEDRLRAERGPGGSNPTLAYPSFKIRFPFPCCWWSTRKHLLGYLHMCKGVSRGENFEEHLWNPNGLNRNILCNEACHIYNLGFPILIWWLCGWSNTDDRREISLC